MLVSKVEVETRASVVVPDTGVRILKFSPRSLESLQERAGGMSVVVAVLGGRQQCVLLLRRCNEVGEGMWCCQGVWSDALVSLRKRGGLFRNSEH